MTVGEFWWLVIARIPDKAVHQVETRDRLKRLLEDARAREQAIGDG